MNNRVAMKITKLSSRNLLKGCRGEKHRHRPYTRDQLERAHHAIIKWRVIRAGWRAIRRDKR
jgi:hypothetical protein